MILYERSSASTSYILELRRHLEASGHRISFASKTLIELKQDPGRVAKMVEADPASAWIIIAGARPVLEWFSQAGIPCFALFGGMTHLPIAGTGPDKLSAFREALHTLFDRGHRKIVMITREERRRGKQGMLEKVFLDELEGRGIKTGSYNLPEWKESADGLWTCIVSMLQVTPPTAIFVGDRDFFLAVMNCIAAQRGAANRLITLICADYDPAFDWCKPPIAHLRWDESAVVRRVVRWADNVAQGKEDRRQRLTPTKFIGGDDLASVGE